jgi:hypothetical protein
MRSRAISEKAWAVELLKAWHQGLSCGSDAGVLCDRHARNLRNAPDFSLNLA